MVRFERPLGVTAVAILIWLQGLLYVAGGMYLIVRFPETEFVEESLGGTTSAVVRIMASMAFALLLFGVTGGLLRGNRRTRLLTMVVMVISFGSAIYVWVVGLQPIFGPITAAIAVTAGVLLWTPRARNFFEDRKPAGTPGTS